MVITGPFVLPADVLLFPVHELPPSVRAQIAAEEGDFAITRPQARQPSKLVDAQGARLIELFRKPTTIVEAVLHFSNARGENPEEALEAAFPLVQQLIAAELLVPAGSPQAGQIAASLKPGERFADWTVERLVYLINDTEVYRVHDPAGAPAALKLGRPDRGPMLGMAFEREAAILMRLGGVPGPRVLGAGASEGRPYLALEWCDGTPVLTAAERFRADPRNRPQLLALASSVVRAFVALHERGVIHGDVQPNNVLVGEDGVVRVLDYGMARVDDASVPLGTAPRGGVGFFYDPEIAAAMRDGRTMPQSSRAAEQYAVAALVRQLLVGRPYLDFSLERETMLRQIIEDRPQPFVRHGVPPWPAAERAIGRALAKDSRERFPSLDAFAAALEEAEADVRPAPPLVPGVSPIAALLDDVLKRVSLSGEVWAATSIGTPLCSLNTGLAGIGYALGRMAALREEPEMLALAELWVRRAARHAGEAAAFYDETLDLTRESLGGISLFHTAAGVALAEALVARTGGDLAGAAEAAGRFIEASEGECRNLDLTLGRSSTIIGCAALVEALPVEATAIKQRLTELGDRVASEIWERVAVLAPAGQDQELTNLGLAHGWAGVLHAQLRWCEASGAALPEGMAARLDQLAGNADEAGEGLRWRWSTGPQGEAVYMPGWCNGSAGFVFLWTLAHRLMGDEGHLRLAERAAWNAWEEPVTLGDLCCGAAGRAYSLLELYRHTGEAEWVGRASILADRAATAIRNWSLRRDSLYKGEVGVALLASDLARPETACMPLVSREAWASPASARRPNSPSPI
jgi:serine/threonine-protein kinase